MYSNLCWINTSSKNLLLDLGSVVDSALAFYARGPRFADIPGEGIFVEALSY